MINRYLDCIRFFFLMMRRPPRSTLDRSSAASDVYKRQPLVLSVHTIVSFDFATSVIPGWHTTIFPPYFVAGAIFSGFAMVQTLMIMTRKILKLEQYITSVSYTHLTLPTSDLV